MYLRQHSQIEQFFPLRAGTLMVATLHRDAGYSLIHLIEDIKHEDIALPDFQPPFVWSSTKTRALFDSIYRGRPVGPIRCQSCCDL